MRNQKCKLGFGREFHDAKCKLYQYVKIQDLKYKFEFGSKLGFGHEI